MDLLQLPKVELHQHLELSVRHETLRELAPQHGIEVPNDRAFRHHFIIEEPMRDLGSVLNKFLDTQKIWSSPEILERITFEVCEDAYNKGVRILELRYAPTFIHQGHEYMSFEDIHMAIVRGMEKAEATYPMAIGLICIIQRILPIPEAEAVTQFAIDHKDSFIGLDLADNEEGFDSKPFSPFFHKAKQAGLGITVHAGEVFTEKSPRYPKDAVEHLGATRIGHGVQVHRDPDMMNYIRKNNITLELCPTSNYLTQAVPGDLNNHPFKILLDAGLPVTINTDDPGIFDTDILKEYKILQELFGLTLDDFKACNETAAKASFINEAKKAKVWS